MARTTSDERVYRANVLWKAKELMESEAKIQGMWAREDIARALKADNEDRGRFFSHFSGRKAREAFSFAIMSLQYLDKIDELRKEAEAEMRRQNA